MLFSTDMLREIERNVLKSSNYKTLKILDELPVNWRNRPENDIIGCVDFTDQLPEPIKYKDRTLRVDKQRKRFQLKNRKGLYRSDGIRWKRIAKLPKRTKKTK